MKINIFDLSNEELVAYMLSISDEMRIRGMQKGCVEETYQRLQEENIRLKKIKDDFFKQAEISHQAVQDKNKIIEKLETVIQEIKNLAELEVMLDKNSKAFYRANIQRILDVIDEVLNGRD